jgi:hypothetical protein
MRGISQKRKQSFGRWFNRRFFCRTGQVYNYYYKYQNEDGILKACDPICFNLPSEQLLKDDEKKKEEEMKTLQENWKRILEDKMKASTRTKKLDFITLFENAKKILPELVNEKGKVNSALLRVRFNLTRVNAYNLATALNTYIKNKKK